jgi:hypothetical protein
MEGEVPALRKFFRAIQKECARPFLTIFLEPVGTICVTLFVTDDVHTGKGSYVAQRTSR